MLAAGIALLGAFAAARAIYGASFEPQIILKALDNAPPGVFDGRSWAYWNAVTGRVPMPARILPGS